MEAENQMPPSGSTCPDYAKLSKNGFESAAGTRNRNAPPNLFSKPGRLLAAGGSMFIEGSIRRAGRSGDFLREAQLCCPALKNNRHAAPHRIVPILGPLGQRAVHSCRLLQGQFPASSPSRCDSCFVGLFHRSPFVRAVATPRTSPAHLLPSRYGAARPRLR